jgi:hypothetical protein
MVVIFASVLSCTNIALRIERASWIRWLTPVILATREADIGRIKFQSQPRQIVCEILSSK